MTLETPLLPQAEQVAARTLLTFTTNTNMAARSQLRAIWRRTLHRLLTWGVREFGAQAVTLTVRQVLANIGNEVNQ